MLKRKSFFLVAFITVLVPSIAYGQFGFPSPSLNIITNAVGNEAFARSVVNGVSSEPDESQPVRAPDVRSLVFKPSLAQRKTNLANFVAKSRAQNQAGGDQLEAMFASTDIIAAIGKSLVLYGLRTDNMADAYTVYWLSAWLAANGRIEDNSRAQAQAIKRQAANALLAVPAVAAAGNAEKQEFAEAMLIQAAMIDSSMQQAKGNPKQLAAIAKAVRQGAKASGLDLDAMNLTEDGFVATNQGE